MRQEKQLQEIATLADWLDTRFKGPGGFRFGLDGIIGLIPGVGDLVTNLCSAYIIVRATQWNYPLSVILRMVLNFLIDNVLDSIPFLGAIFDFFFKANTANLKLMRAYAADPVTTRRRSLFWVGGVLAILGLVVITATAISIYLLYMLMEWVQRGNFSVT